MIVTNYKSNLSVRGSKTSSFGFSQSLLQVRSGHFKQELLVSERSKKAKEFLLSFNISFLLLSINFVYFEVKGSARVYKHTFSLFLLKDLSKLETFEHATLLF